MKLKYLLLFAALCLVGYGTFKLAVDKLILSEVQSDRLYDPAFDTRPLSTEEQQEVEKALDQHYTYAEKGGQAYVFFSEDGNYVIKFFKQRHFRDPVHLDYIPFIKKYRAFKYEKKRKRLRHEYLSYKLAFEELPEETALLYIHLNKTAHLKKSIVFHDKLRMEHLIDLDKTDFILQRKADLVHDKIDAQMAQGDFDGAKKTVSDVMQLILTRCKKGFYDKDPKIATNCGILKDRAIKIDVGRFIVDPRMKQQLYYKPELYRLTRPFLHWLEQKYPELAHHLNQETLQVIIHD